MKFPIVYADPAWKYANRLTGRGRTKFGSGASGKYKTERTEDMAGFPVEAVLDDPAMLFMWVTMPFLEDGLWLMKQWGCTFTTITHAWIKIRKKPLPGPCTAENMSAMTRRLPGHYTASNEELVLCGWHGSPILPLVRMESQVIYAPSVRHSHKPAAVQEWIERCYAGPYLELFATEERPGWKCLGNQIDGRDLRDSLPELLTR